MKRVARSAAQISTLPMPDRDHVQGPIHAPIKLVEYGDYECPFCGVAYAVVKKIQERLGSRLCFAFRNFPLTNAHPHAEHAAEAAEAAHEQERFWEMHDLLYQNQNALEDEDLAQYASDLGLDARRLISEIQLEAHASRIQEDFLSGARNGVNGTPSFFINGVRYDGEYDVENLLAALTGQTL